MKKPKRSRRPAKNVLLAEKLQTWSTNNGFDSHPYMRLLIEGISRRKNLAMLSEIDALEHFPRHRNLNSDRRDRLILTLTVIRNVAVFVPVALTWSAVSHSTAAFARFVSANPDTVANFLEFWQNGYGYLSSEWTIGTVANLDFLIIVLVILLTLYISLATNHTRQKMTYENSKFSVERLELALEVREFLHDKRRMTNVTMNQSLGTAIQNLTNATYELDALTQRIPRAD